MKIKWMFPFLLIACWQESDMYIFTRCVMYLLTLYGSFRPIGGNLAVRF